MFRPLQMNVVFLKQGLQKHSMWGEDAIPERFAGLPVGRHHLQGFAPRGPDARAGFLSGTQTLSAGTTPTVWFVFGS